MTYNAFEVRPFPRPRLLREPGDTQLSPNRNTKTCSLNETANRLAIGETLCFSVVTGTCQNSYAIAISRQHARRASGARGKQRMNNCQLVEREMRSGHAPNN